MVKILCFFKFTTFLARSDAVEHFSYGCPEKKRRCSVQSCSFWGNKEEIVKHEEEDLDRHNQLLTETNAELTNLLMSKVDALTSLLLSCLQSVINICFDSDDLSHYLILNPSFVSIVLAFLIFFFLDLFLFSQCEDLKTEEKIHYMWHKTWQIDDFRHNLHAANRLELPLISLVFKKNKLAWRIVIFPLTGEIALQLLSKEAVFLRLA